MTTLPTMQRNRLSRYTQPLLALVLGASAFLLVVGPQALDPQNIAWLPPTDPVTQFLGWHFYRFSPWQFPLGLNPDYGLELANSIVYSDSIPLLALLFKPFGPLLPETFQYLGLWLLACFMLQAWFGWKLVGLISTHPIIRLCGAGLFVFAPPMLWRLQVHLTLVGHFLILAALYFNLRPFQRRRSWHWVLLATISALVHVYILAMVLLLWLADLLPALRRHTLPLLAAESLAVFSGVLLACWQAGYFSIGNTIGAFGYGYYRMNLLSLIDPSGWSWLLPDLPEAKGDYEGFNYLGLGVLFIGLLTLGGVRQLRDTLIVISRRQFPLLLALVALTAFAVTNQIGLGAWNFSLPLPAPFRLAEIFRSSGRVFWPVFYALLLLILYLIVRRYPASAAARLLALALTLQVIDSSVAWRQIHSFMAATPATTWPTPLQDPFWNQAAGHYAKVRLIMPANVHPHWKTFAIYAARHRLATNAVYLARLDSEQDAAAVTDAKQIIANGSFATDTLYILDDDQVQAVLPNIDHADLIAHIDGFNVVAPGWAHCASCIQPSHTLMLPSPGESDRVSNVSTDGAI
jgi:hypothetical protein